MTSPNNPPTPLMPSALPPVDPWFPIRKPVPDARLRLFCFPFAGGGVTIYHGWNTTLPPRAAYRRDRGHVEDEGWSTGAEKCR